jgi:hypothetical protein
MQLHTADGTRKYLTAGESQFGQAASKRAAMPSCAKPT